MGVRMKKAVLFLLLVIFLLFGKVAILAQTKSTITVKGSELSNGVVFVDVVKEGKTYELQCNQGVSSCALLKNGKYQLVELPPNHGMYECRDVEVYADHAPGAEPTKKLGEYCLTEK